MNHQSFIDAGISQLKYCTCLRRCFVAIIADPLSGHIISTGRNGAPSGKPHCDNEGWCMRKELNIAPGSNYEMCLSVHAEQNAIIRAGQLKCRGAYMYIVGQERETGIFVTKPQPCFLCTKMIINAQINKVFLYTGKNIIDVNIAVLYDQYVRDIYKDRG
jgi:dCMP deaminase